MGKIQVNDPIRPREFTTIQGEQITAPHSQLHSLPLTSN